MADETQLALLRRGVTTWNEKRRNRPGVVDLSGADLASANLDRADFQGANPTAANLTSASLLHANFEDANLAGGLEGRERRKAGVENSGLRLLMATILEAIQRDWS
jgi:uncharacterized protein YjbI with pentapeptide repeats